jgi:glycolate oxidase
VTATPTPCSCSIPKDEAQQERARASPTGKSWTWRPGSAGTITGEHGVGRLKAPWLAPYLGEDVMELNHRIKQALDPDNIFNPGAVYTGLV